MLLGTVTYCKIYFMLFIIYQDLFAHLLLRGKACKLEAIQEELYFSWCWTWWDFSPNLFTEGTVNQDILYSNFIANTAKNQRSLHIKTETLKEREH